MKTKKIQVPTIWYKENIESLEFQIRRAPGHLAQLENRHRAHREGKPTEFDTKHKVTIQMLTEYIREAKLEQGKQEKELKKFIEKYSSDKRMKPDYAGALKYLKGNAGKINKCLDIKSKWDYYNQMGVISEKFFLPTMDEYFDKVTDLFTKAGIESY